MQLRSAGFPGPGRGWGLSLMELVVTCSIFFLLMSLIHHIYTSGSRTHRMGETMTDTHKVLLVALARIESEARGAKAVTVCDKTGKCMADGVRGVRLSFWPPLLDPSGDQVVIKDIPQWNKSAHLYYKEPEGTQLVREVRTESGSSTFSRLGVLGKEGKIEFMMRGSLLHIFIEAPGEQKGGDTGKTAPWKVEERIYLENMVTP
jgi:hypothetical protein